MDNKYAGMTVNERLYVSGLMDKFDKAMNEKNVEEVVSILKNVELNNLSISPILESLGLVEDGEGLL
jgi:hypothetical protein